MVTVVDPTTSYGTNAGDPDRAALIGGVGQHLAPEQVHAFVREQLAGADLEGKRVCLVVPDGTRTCPLPLLMGAAYEALHDRAAAVTVVIALGTHQGMEEDHLARHLGFEPGARESRYPGWTIINHESWLPETFTSLGTIGADRLAELTGGLMRDTSVQVRINRHVAEADVAIVVGPVFPHEVVGFSGGNKYFFPGVSGPELINLSHWVGALITSAADDRHPRSHPGQGAGQRGRNLDPRRTAGALPGRGIRHRHAACGRLRHTGGRLGGVRSDLRGNPYLLPRGAGQAGAVDHADQVRRHLDRGERFLQAGADRRRRR